MGLLSGNRRPFPDCEAVVGLHFSDDALDALSVTANGDLGMVSHLPPAYFDKILYNARRSGEVGHDLLLRAEAIWQQAADDLTEETVFVSTVPVHAGTEVAPEATATVKLSAALGTRRIGAETSFSPLKAANPTVAEFALWALWDWTVGNLENWEVIGVLVQRMIWQCAAYNGNLPGLRDLGRTPFLAAEEFDALPTI